MKYFNVAGPCIDGEHYMVDGCCYEALRDGGGGLILSPEEWANVTITTDVVLVTYHNDCVWKSGRTCYENLRVMPPIILYQRP